MSTRVFGFTTVLFTGLAVSLSALLLLPIASLLFSVSIEQLQLGIAHPLFTPALKLSLKSTTLSLAVVMTAGTPIAWWLAAPDKAPNRGKTLAGLLFMLPIVIPPAVLGVALLSAFGHSGVFAPWLNAANLSIPFTRWAVLLAQILVSAPFFIQSATSAFARINPSLLLVAQSLGASGTACFFRVALPLALPGLVSGACLAWARALGEFGATLLFAGNMPGETQTLPLAIYSAMESDLQLAIVFSAFMFAISAILLGFVYHWSHRSSTKSSLAKVFQR